MLASRRNIFDKLALIFLLAHLSLLLLNWRLYPTELDTPYHLLMGKMFVEKGGVPVWDDYEFAPMGRPHLYPPLQHLIIRFVYGITRLSYMDIGRLLAVSQTMLALFSVWFFSRKFFNSCVAFLALIFFASNTEMWWWQTSVAPIALITGLYLFFIYYFYKEKIFLPTVIFTCCLYLHYGMSVVAAATILIASLSAAHGDKRYLKNSLAIFASSLLLFLPWALRIYKYRGNLFSRSVDVNTLDVVSLRITFCEIFLHLNFTLWLFLLFGLWYCYRHRKNGFKYVLLLSAFWSNFIFLFLFHGVRFNAHTPIVTSVLAGLGFYLVLRKAGRLVTPLVRIAARVSLALLIFACIFFEFHYLTPRLVRANKANIAFMGIKRTEVFFRPTPLLNEMLALASGMPLTGKHVMRVQHFFTERETHELLDYINRHIPENAVIHIYNGALANYITLQTGRRTDWGMFFEIISPELMRSIYGNLRSGYYISTDQYFKELLPSEYKKTGKFPEIIEQIGKFYIGYLPGPGEDAGPHISSGKVDSRT